MSFFRPLPPSPEPPLPRRRPPWLAPPENELGVCVPARFVLAQTQDLAIAVIDTVAYSTGVAVTLALRLAPHATDVDPRVLFMHVPARKSRTSHAPAGMLRFGVVFSDGRRVSNSGSQTVHGDLPPPISLLPRGGSTGSGNSFEFSYWIFPLPPPGRLTFELAWPARGIDEQRYEIDATTILGAGRRSQILWPDDRPFDTPVVLTSS